IGVGTTDYREVTDLASLELAVGEIGAHGVLKTVRLGYDGKGQVMLNAGSDLAAAWKRLRGGNALPQEIVAFACEPSVTVAPTEQGAAAVYVPAKTRPLHPILDTTIAPAPLAEEVAMRAEGIARHVAEKLGIVGLLAVEMFVTRQGELLVNELAP